MFARNSDFILLACCASFETFLSISFEFFSLSSVFSMKTIVLFSSEAISPSSSLELSLTLTKEPFFIDSKPFSSSDRALDIWALRVKDSTKEKPNTPSNTMLSIGSSLFLSITIRPSDCNT